MSDAELLSPAGDFDTALAAFDAGADAVYCGLADFSARAFAKNLSFGELRRLVRVAAKRGKAVYVTFNTLVEGGETDAAIRALAELEDIAPTALIVQDLGVARICRRRFPGLALHASTQLVAHNLEGVLALRDLGFSRAVLARELSIAEIASIAKRCGGMELECFIHGALCYSISGLCLFSSLEKGRSGNRGRCAYCCRQAYEADALKTPSGRFLFSMKDLRLGEDARKLVDAGVKSLKIEGRMKSPLYVASATAYYRAILDGAAGAKGAVTVADLETVFSRRTTELYLNGRPAESVIDAESVGHLGTPIGEVKRVTKDRDGVRWLRFHTMRAIEKHDGLQFAAPGGGKPVGFGISEMRTAISRRAAFEAPAGADVEVRVPDDADGVSWAAVLRPGAKVHCSMSNAVKRRFPVPAFRPADYPGVRKMDVEVSISQTKVEASATCGGVSASAVSEGRFEPSKNPDNTFGAVEKAFSRLGDGDYSLGSVRVSDPGRLFVPMGVLNDLRRNLVERLDAARSAAKEAKIAEATSEIAGILPATAVWGQTALPRPPTPRRTVKLRVGQTLPGGEWDEVVLAIDAATPPASASESFAALVADGRTVRVALPVYTPEPDFNRLRILAKRLMREGAAKWEAADLAGLRMLRSLGADDVSADWTLYAMNGDALAALAELGVGRFVASPENDRANAAFLAESGFDVEFLSQQSTPLFVSLTEPAAVPAKSSGLSAFRLGALWVTTKTIPRTFPVPPSAPTRIDLSWDER